MKEKSNQKAFISIPLLIGIIAFIIAMGGVGYGAIEYNNSSKIIQEAEQLTREEKYIEANKKLELVQNSWLVKGLGIKKQEVSSKIEENNKLKEDKSEYDQGIAEFNEKNWDTAKELLSKVSDISPYYQEAKSKAEESQAKITEKQITEAVNRAKVEIGAKQRSSEYPPVVQENQNEVTNIITEADLEKILPYVGNIVCHTSTDANGHYKTSEGSASLWITNWTWGRNIILTNYHVIAAAFEICDVNLDYGLYRLDVQNISSSAFNNIIDFAFLKIASVSPGLENKFPSPGFLTSELILIPQCPIKMPLGSSVGIIGYPIGATSQIDVGSSSYSIANKTVTTGIVSSYDENPIYNGYPDVNYFVSAKIDSGNSGGLAVSKHNKELCILGLPTWVSKGNYENMGIIQSIHNIWNPK